MRIHLKRSGSVLLLTGLVFLSNAAGLRAQYWCRGFQPYGFDGWVWKSIAFEGGLVVSGQFSGNGVVTASGVARWDGTQWHAMGNPHAVAPFQEFGALGVYQGDLYLGGRRYQQQALLLKWNGVDWEMVDEPLGVCGDGQITSMVEYDGKLVIAGDLQGPFSAPFGGSVGSWDGSAWITMGDPPDMNCAAIQFSDLEVYQGDLYVTGTFDAADGQPVHSLARWDGAAWTPVEGWANGGLEEGLYDTAGQPGEGWGYALATYQDLLVIGGDFQQAGDLVASNLVGWDGTTQSWVALGDVNGLVYSVQSRGDDLYVGGAFTAVDGVPAQNLAVYDGNSWSEAAGGTSATVLDLGTYDEQLVLGGAFVTAGSQSVSHLALWNGAALTHLSNPGQGLTSHVRAMVEFDGKLIAGGTFGEAGDVAARRLASWDGTGWTEFGGGAGGPVNTLVSDGVHLWAGGYFREIGGLDVDFIARWNGTAWESLGTGAPWTVNAIEHHDGVLFVGGYNYLSRWDGSTWQTIPTDPADAAVLALASYGDKLVVGGTWYGGPFLKTYDAGVWAPMVGGPNLLGVDDRVTTFLERDGLLYVGGWFQSAAGQATRGLARWDGATLEAWGGQVPGNFLLEVHSLAAVGGRLYTGGYGGNGFYYLEDGASSWTSASSGWPGRATFAISPYQGELYVGGSFSVTSAGTKMAYFGQLCEPGTTTRSTPTASVQWSLFPNPFNPRMTVRFDVGERLQPVSVRVLDTRGRLVRTLMASSPLYGSREVHWNGVDGHGRPVASGVYVVELHVGPRVLTKRAVLLK